MIEVMVKMFHFSLAVSVMLAVLWIIFHFCLSDVKDIRANRITLVCIYLLSPMTVPLACLIADMAFPGKEALNVIPSSTGSSSLSHIWQVISVIWCIGMSVCLLFTLIDVMRILRLRANTVEEIYEGRRIRISDKDISPFSFGGLIMMNRKDFSENPEMIVRHEEGHVVSHHLFDLILARIFVIFCWYNPAAWLLQREIKTVHEYQADEYVLSHGCDAQTYQHLLINRSIGRTFSTIANTFAYRHLRKRISMMNMPVASHRLRYILPVMGGLFAVGLLGATNLNTFLLPSIPNHQSVSNSSDETGEGNLRGMGIYYIDGKEIKKSDLNTVPVSEIKSITINKQRDRIDIEMKQDAEK